jgi:hypothetical protein
MFFCHEPGACAVVGLQVEAALCYIRASSVSFFVLQYMLLAQITAFLLPLEPFTGLDHPASAYQASQPLQLEFRHLFHSFHVVYMRVMRAVGEQAAAASVSLYKLFRDAIVDIAKVSEEKDLSALNLAMLRSV